MNNSQLFYHYCFSKPKITSNCAKTSTSSLSVTVVFLNYHLLTSNKALEALESKAKIFQLGKPNKITLLKEF